MDVATILADGDGLMQLYGHSSSLVTSPGDWVKAGEAIAQAGRTGGTNDPAVYFEARHNGKPDNPRTDSCPHLPAPATLYELLVRTPN